MSQLGPSMYQRHPLRLLDTESCWVPPAAGNFRLGGAAVKLHEFGLRVTYSVNVVLPLVTVTVSVATAVVLFGGNVATMLDAPVPNDGEMVWIAESPVAAQAQDAGVVAILQFTYALSLTRMFWGDVAEKPVHTGPIANCSEVSGVVFLSSFAVHVPGIFAAGKPAMSIQYCQQ